MHVVIHDNIKKAHAKLTDHVNKSSITIKQLIKCTQKIIVLIMLTVLAKKHRKNYLKMYSSK